MNLIKSAVCFQRHNQLKSFPADNEPSNSSCVFEIISFFSWLAFYQLNDQLNH